MSEIMGFVTMPGVAALNRRLASIGLKAIVTVINCNAGLTFGRRASSMDPTLKNSAEQIEAAIAGLTDSVNKVGEALGPSIKYGIPNLTGVGFSAAPHELHSAELVQVTRGSGFLLAENLNPPCLALVTPAHMSDMALLTPFADAPPVWGVYIGQRVDGSWFVITFCIMAAWHRLPITEGDLVRETIQEVKRQVEREGVMFDYANLWAFVGPGASEGFEFKGDRSEKLGPHERDGFVHTERIPNPKAGQLGEPDEIDMPYLNLRGWVAEILRTLEIIGREADGRPIYARVPAHQLFVLEHNTVTSPCYASKRARVGVGIAQPGLVLPSNGMVGVVLPR